MVKCVVSGCPNRVVGVNQGGFNRPPKRFFNFPKDPVQVKVWLAALRETDKQDVTEQHLICEDHFLPEDVSKNGVKSDAIPIMPPFLDGPLGPTTSWGAECYEEEEKWEDDVAEDEDDAPAAPDPAQQNAGAGLENPPETLKSRADVRHKKLSIQKKKSVPLGLLTRRLLELLLAAPGGSLDLTQATMRLRARRGRVHNIIKVLDEINLVQKESVNRIKWIGKSPVSSFLWKNLQNFRREVEHMKLVEDALDTVIESCARQLFSLTDDVENSACAYVTHEDISRLSGFEERTVIVIKAPEETKLEIPSPKENNIQVHLKAGKGPIVVLTSDLRSGFAVTSEPRGKTNSFFLSVEESRIRTTLHTESSGPPSAVQSALPPALHQEATCSQGSHTNLET